MAGHTSQELDKATRWGGKLSPYGASYGKLMMWFFLVSDALTFGGLLTAYGFIRHSYQGEWPIGEEVFHHFPFMGETPLPLIYVAFMTFILIVSSVTMVLAVEAGHRNDRKGVTKWMIWTVIGGFVFLGSQVWEWSHFIHGSHFGKVQLADGSFATVDGDYGAINKLVLLDDQKHTLISHNFNSGEQTILLGGKDHGHSTHDDHAHDNHGHHDHGHEEDHTDHSNHSDHNHGHSSNHGHSDHGHGHGEEDHSVMEGAHAEHVYRHALESGHVYASYLFGKPKEYKNPDKPWIVDSVDYPYEKLAYILTTYEAGKETIDTIGVLKDEEGHLFAIYKDKNVVKELKIREDGNKFMSGDVIEGAQAQLLYDQAINRGEARRVIFGADLKDNEYGPVQYGQFFFFITGFHGFHVFSGVLINLIILIQVLMGVMEKRRHYEMVEKVGLYWHFVDLVWVFVFTFFYLI